MVFPLQVAFLFTWLSNVFRIQQTKQNKQEKTPFYCTLQIAEIEECTLIVLTPEEIRGKKLQFTQLE